MRSITVPIFAARDTFDQCVDSLRNRGLKERLRAIGGNIEVAAAAYEELGAQRAWYRIAAATQVGAVTSDELGQLYKNTLSRKRSRTRPIYDEILAAAPRGICPLCAQRDAKTLDHFLPKSAHPALVVSPINLVPSCSDCNKAKSDAQAGREEEQTLHPYFDLVDADQWLRAEVIQGEPVTVRFLVVPPATWPDALTERVRHHFAVFRLGALYTTHAAVELANIRTILARLADSAGPDGVRGRLIEDAEGRREQFLNAWQTAFYEALARSDWFCAEGYQMIG